MDAVNWFIGDNPNIGILNLPDPTIAEAVLRLKNMKLLQKLKQLNTAVHEADDLKVALSQCRQMEILRAEIHGRVTFRRFADAFESADIQELQLVWNGPSIKEFLPVFQRWQQLRKLSLKVQKGQPCTLPIKELYELVMQLKHLNHLELLNNFALGEIQFFKDLISCQRPYFVCKISAVTDKF